MSGRRPTKAQVANVACPRCLAQPHEPCVYVTGMLRAERPNHHMERVARYRDGLFGPLPPVPAPTEKQA